MKSMIFLCLSLVIMAGIARVYMAGGLDGILGTDSGSGNFRDKAPKNVKAVTTDKDIVVYKWRDDKGVMHFGEAPPQDTQNVEKIELKTNENVMNAVAVNKTVDEESGEIKPMDVSNPYSPQGMADMIKQTKELTRSLNERQAGRDEMLNGLMQP